MDSLVFVQHPAAAFIVDGHLTRLKRPFFQATERTIFSGLLPLKGCQLFSLIGSSDGLFMNS